VIILLILLTLSTYLSGSHYFNKNRNTSFILKLLFTKFYQKTQITLLRLWVITCFSIKNNHLSNLYSYLPLSSLSNRLTNAVTQFIWSCTYVLSETLTCKQAKSISTTPSSMAWNWFATEKKANNNSWITCKQIHS
jgi:hypothetical protein